MHYRTDQRLACHQVTPGQPVYKGRGLEVVYGYYKTPAGEMFVALSGDAVCYLGFAPGGERDFPVRRMKNHMPFAAFSQNDQAIAKIARKIMAIWQGNDAAKKIPVILSGTGFQQRVWTELLKIPHGKKVSYKDVAVAIGRPTASRAVGGAVAANPVSLIVPCHRVVQSNGDINNYAWGNIIKKKLLEMELQP